MKIQWKEWSGFPKNHHDYTDRPTFRDCFLIRRNGTVTHTVNSISPLGENDWKHTGRGCDIVGYIEMIEVYDALKEVYEKNGAVE